MAIEKNPAKTKMLENRKTKLWSIQYWFEAADNEYRNRFVVCYVFDR